MLFLDENFERFARLGTTHSCRCSRISFIWKGWLYRNVRHILSVTVITNPEWKSRCRTTSGRSTGNFRPVKVRYTDIWARFGNNRFNLLKCVKMILAMNFSSSSKELPISQKLQRMVLSMLVNLDQGTSLFVKIGYPELPFQLYSNPY